MAQITVGTATDTDVAISLATIEKEVRAGLPCHAARRAEARDNLVYFRAKNLACIERRDSEDHLEHKRRPKRTSKITRKVVRKLTEDLYNPGPTRKLEGSDAVDAWLQEVYAANNINGIMQQADRMATLNATAAVQAVATGKPEKPISLYVWGAEEFEPFFTADDHVTPWAICTIALVTEGDKQYRRLELWSAKEHRVYLTRPTEAGFVIGSTPADYHPELSGTPAGSGVNPYGVLPFAFVHDEAPVTDFWEGGIGNPLREANAELDRELSDLAQHIQKYLNPEGFLINVNAAFRSTKRPGGWQHLKPGKDSDGDPARGEPKAFYVQAQLAVQDAWFDIIQHGNSTLEDLDVPLVAVREDASTDLSGIAIVAKHMPLLARTKSRQVPFTSYEQDVAKLTLTVAGNYYGRPEAAGGAGAKALQEAAKDAKLSVTFPAPTFPLPSPERDEADEREVVNNYKSEFMAIQERYGLTRDQTVERVRQIAKDKAEFAEIMAEFAEKPEPGGVAGDLADLSAEEPTDAANTAEADTETDDNFFTGMSH